MIGNVDPDNSITMTSAHFLRFRRVGKRVVNDAGPLTGKRMETVEDEFHARSLAFIEKSAKAGKPFFLRQSSTRLHAKTHLSPKWGNSNGSQGGGK
jgi:arylsulfatase